jgi:hypothetical protein
MGRSGTSLTASVVEALGVDFGAHETMLPANERDNARGYWEQEVIYDLNEGLLETFGGSWESPPELAPEWQRSPGVLAARADARRALGELGFGAGGRRWGWKDPRGSLTIPFWRELIGEMDYVLCVRDPAQVAASIAHRGSHKLDFRDSVELWLLYIRAALENTRGSRRIIVLTEDLVREPRLQIALLGAFVGAGGADVRRAQEMATELVQPGLWHHREQIEPARVHEACPEAAELYGALVAEVRSAVRLGLARRREAAPSLHAGVRACQTWPG